MTPSGNGRHCDNCSKTVVDFSSWSDADLYRFFTQPQGRVCGRFATQQLNRAINIPYQPHSRLYRMTVALGLTLLALHSKDAMAQRRRNSPPLQAGMHSQYFPVKPYFPVPGASSGSISGRVFDTHGVALNNAIVQVSNDTVKRDFHVGSDGYFSFPNLDSDLYDMFVSFEGYDTMKIVNVQVFPGSETTENVVLRARVMPWILGQLSVEEEKVFYTKARPATWEKRLDKSAESEADDSLLEQDGKWPRRWDGKKQKPKRKDDIYE